MLKKEIKKLDPFISTSARVLGHLHKNSRSYMFALVGLVVFSGIVGVWYFQHSKKEGLASDAYYEAIRKMEHVFLSKDKNEPNLDDLKEPLQQLQAVSKKYSKTMGSVFSSLKLGHVYYNQKQYKEALTFFHQAEKQCKDRFFSTLISYNLAYTYESLKEWNKCESYFEKLQASDIDFWSVSGYLGKGRCLEGLGQREQAKQVYETLKQKLPKYQKQADEYLSLLSYEKK